MPKHVELDQLLPTNVRHEIRGITKPTEMILPHNQLLRKVPMRPLFVRGDAHDTSWIKMTTLPLPQITECLLGNLPSNGFDCLAQKMYCPQSPIRLDQCFRQQHQSSGLGARCEFRWWKKLYIVSVVDNAQMPNSNAMQRRIQD